MSPGSTPHIQLGCSTWPRFRGREEIIGSGRQEDKLNTFGILCWYISKVSQQGSKNQREKIVRHFCLGIFDTWMWETGTMDQRILLQFIDLDRSILCKLLVQTTILFARLCKTFDKIRVCALVPLCKLTFPHAICHLCTKPIHYLGNVYASALFKKRQNQFGQCPKWWRKSVFFPGRLPFCEKEMPNLTTFPT